MGCSNQSAWCGCYSIFSFFVTELCVIISPRSCYRLCTLMPSCCPKYQIHSVHSKLYMLSYHSVLQLDCSHQERTFFQFLTSSQEFLLTSMDLIPLPEFIFCNTYPPFFLVKALPPELKLYGLICISWLHYLFSWLLRRSVEWSLFFCSLF